MFFGSDPGVRQQFRCGLGLPLIGRHGGGEELPKDAFIRFKRHHDAGGKRQGREDFRHRNVQQGVQQRENADHESGLAKVLYFGHRWQVCNQ